ncbi:hypothetical protein PPYR_14054 [Photinus pyralis]|uniref:SCP domain-containing protein n=2 Tax=Photinus pyralis TaxID=7054 RepID=A0A5N4A448_PHOPY|nr:Golgi-associated plant pathogenesis-related protein 1-like [Photinus pyralis]KAB0792093.1 hypothetical protein PPYR_14054 [Photinus pyralis]
MLIQVSIFVLCSVAVLEGVVSAELDPRAADLTAFRKQSLDRHNHYRKLHGCPPLVLNDTLSAYAQEWAQEISLMPKPKHRPAPKYGENLSYASSSKAGYAENGEKSVDRWYKEISKYTFGEEPTKSGTGHFTQVIWKSSKQLGVGTVAKDGKVWVVANYDPRGNFKGKYRENVPPLL